LIAFLLSLFAIAIIASTKYKYPFSILLYLFLSKYLPNENLDRKNRKNVKYSRKIKDIKTTANKFEEKEYFKLPMSRDIINGLVKIKVRTIINSNNCNTNIENLYII
tara:strand:- start:461 stop:781 length:321 start_codon:yes stop_codon:yes gene_type:complete